MLGLLVLGRQSNTKKTTSVLIGAVLPDLAIFTLYFWHLWLGTPESTIWSVEYYKPGWQAFIDCFNSIPLLLISIIICWKTNQRYLLLFFASMLLHTFGDLPLHHDDAHRHFFPFSDWRFTSPVSYWDANHYGNWFSLIEVLAVFGTATFLYIKETKLRVWVVSIGLIYTAFWAYVGLFWF